MDQGLQVNVKTSKGTLLNVYAPSGPELQQLIAELLDAVEEVTNLEATYGAVAAVSGNLGGTFASNTGGAQAPSGGLPEPEGKEFCAHGQMKWQTGTAKASGNVYGLWVCSTGQKPEQGGCTSKWPPRKR